MNAITPPQAFTFETVPVRTVVRDDEPWFVGKDVCAALGHTNHKVALSRLDHDERGVYNVDPPRPGSLGGGVQQVTIISEAGVYRLIFTSRTEAAERFKRWLAHEVLPALRRNGFYAVPGDDDLPMNRDMKVWGVAIAKINAAARLMSLAQRIYGPQAARKLWERDTTLPSLKDFEIAAIAGTAEDDPAGCLAHLLRLVARKEQTVGDLMRLAVQDRAAAKQMPEFGIIIDPPGSPGYVFIASDSEFLAQGFIDTQWAGEWRFALQQITGAKWDRNGRRVGGAISRGVLLPKHAVLDAMAGKPPPMPPL